MTTRGLGKSRGILSFRRKKKYENIDESPKVPQSKKWISDGVKKLADEGVSGPSPKTNVKKVVDSNAAKRSVNRVKLNSGRRSTPSRRRMSSLEKAVHWYPFYVSMEYEAPEDYYQEATKEDLWWSKAFLAQRLFEFRSGLILNRDEYDDGFGSRLSLESDVDKRQMNQTKAHDPEKRPGESCFKEFPMSAGESVPLRWVPGDVSSIYSGPVEDFKDTNVFWTEQELEKFLERELENSDLGPLRFLTTSVEERKKNLQCSQFAAHCSRQNIQWVAGDVAQERFQRGFEAVPASDIWISDREIQLNLRNEANFGTLRFHRQNDSQPIDREDRRSSHTDRIASNETRKENERLKREQLHVDHERQIWSHIKGYIDYYNDLLRTGQSVEGMKTPQQAFATAQHILSMSKAQQHVQNSSQFDQPEVRDNCGEVAGAYEEGRITLEKTQICQNEESAAGMASPSVAIEAAQKLLTSKQEANQLGLDELSKNEDAILEQTKVYLRQYTDLRKVGARVNGMVTPEKAVEAAEQLIVSVSGRERLKELRQLLSHLHNRDLFASANPRSSSIKNNETHRPPNQQMWTGGHHYHAGYTPPVSDPFAVDQVPNNDSDTARRGLNEASYFRENQTPNHNAGRNYDDPSYVQNISHHHTPINGWYHK